MGTFEVVENNEKKINITEREIIKTQWRILRKKKKHWRGKEIITVKKNYGGGK